MRFRSSNTAQRLAWGIPVFVVGVLALPLFTDRTFGNDWPDHLWLVWQQSQAITQLGHPSYFLQSASGVYEPFFAFYGGTFYAFTGGISALLGEHPTVAYVAVIIGAFAGAYAGWTWLAHQVGVRGWWAQMPGLIYVTSPYIITNSFGRGDMPEFVGTASIPLVAASALAVLRGERLRLPSAAILVFASAWFTACHNITALWGTTFLVATAIVLLFAVGSARREIRPRRVLALFGLAVLGAAINAWYLFPTLAYAGRTAIAKRGGVGAFQFDTAHLLFDPLRNEPNEIVSPRNGEGWLNAPGTFNVQMPVLAFGWALAALALAWRRLAAPVRRFAIGMLAIVGVLVWLILTNMSIVPNPWQHIQFPYRAQTYVTLGVCALVLAAVVALPRIAARRLRAIAIGAIAFIAAMSFTQAILQQWSQQSSLPTRRAIFQPNDKFPPSWYAEFDYADASMRAIGFGDFVAVPGVTVTGGNGESILPVPVHGLRDTSVVTFPSPGPRPMVTNVYGGPYLVKVTGARVIGRSPSNELAIEPLAPKGQEARVTFSTAHTLPVVLGKAVTGAAIILCLLLTAWAAWRSAQRRRRLRRRALRTTA
ncbi:MAG: hypothetical protein ABSG95_05670 [Solirubrobacteraceae bacterium]